MTHIQPNTVRASNHIDAKILDRTASLKAAWDNQPSADAGEQEFDAYLRKAFYEPEEELRTMRPHTPEGALAKVKFYRWYGKEVGSQDPIEDGLDIAAADLAHLAPTSTAPTRDIALILAREWLHIEDTFASVDSGIDDVVEALGDVQAEVSARLFKMPATTMAGLLAKIEVLAGMNGVYRSNADNFESQLEAARDDETRLLISLVRDARRLSGSA